MIWKKSESEEPPAKDKDHVQPPPSPTPAVRVAQQQPARDRALIGATIEIKGNLVGNEDLQIEGRLDGKIELHENSVTVGKNGRVKADIFGRRIVVSGEVEGNLYGEEQIVLHQSSKVTGNLFAPRVTLEDGAQFKGSIDMGARMQTGAQTVQGESPSGPLAASQP